MCVARCAWYPENAGKIGWNVAYDFNESDLSISKKLNGLYLGKCFERGEVIPWETLR